MRTIVAIAAAALLSVGVHAQRVAPMPPAQIVPLPSAELPEAPPPPSPPGPPQSTVEAPAGQIPSEQTSPEGQTPAGQTQPAGQPPATPAQPGTPPAIPAPVTPTLPLNPRALTGQAGMIFTSVRPERVVDFETVMTYLQEAIANTTDAATRQQWQGLRILKGVEPGPNASVVYVFLIDPVVSGADYSLGPVLSAAYPEKIQEIWKLYTGAIIQQSVMNLNAFTPPVLPPSAQPTPGGVATPPASGVPAAPGAPAPPAR